MNNLQILSQVSRHLRQPVVVDFILSNILLEDILYDSWDKNQWNCPFAYVVGSERLFCAHVVASTNRFERRIEYESS
jgi:hypothetical protein